MKNRDGCVIIQTNTNAVHTEVALNPRVSRHALAFVQGHAPGAILTLELAHR